MRNDPVSPPVPGARDQRSLAEPRMPEQHYRVGIDRFASLQRVHSGRIPVGPSHQRAGWIDRPAQIGHHARRFSAAIRHKIRPIETRIGNARIHEAVERHFGDICAEDLGRDEAECTLHLAALADRSVGRGDRVTGKGRAVGRKGLADHKREWPIPGGSGYSQPELARTLTFTDRDRYLFKPSFSAKQIGIDQTWLTPFDR